MRSIVPGSCRKCWPSRFFARLTGGELRIYDDVLRNNRLARSDAFRVVEPLHNSIVFFWARAMHEVAAVRVVSRAFRDSRFTVNGWINRR